MARWRDWMLALILATGFSLNYANATEPAPYLVLPPAPRSAYLLPVNTPRYAYGWFGVQPRHHWSRHFGFYRDYTQWKAK